MTNAINIAKMSKTEKLRTMEVLWGDITNGAGQYASPSWHFIELDRTEREIKSGKEKFTKWQKAKKLIQQRIK